jgi:aspartate kinase
MIVQNISSDHKKTDVTFTIKREDLKKSVELIKNNKEIKCEKIDYDDKVSKVSIVGAGMITHPGVAYKMFNSLAKEKINIMVISTSEIKISVLINEEQTQKAVVAIHSAFDLD